jgi:hypothetical protein
MNTRAVPPTVALADDAYTTASVVSDATLVTDVGEPSIAATLYATAGGPWANVLTVYATLPAARNLRDALTEAIEATS